MLESAEKSIKIVSKEIPNLDDLKVALDRDVEVEVIVGYADNVMDFIPLTKKGVIVHELSEKPFKYYDIVDNNHVRLEGKRGDLRVQYTVYDASKSVAPSLLHNFKTLKEKAEEQSNRTYRSS